MKAVCGKSSGICECYFMFKNYVFYILFIFETFLFLYNLNI